MATLTLVLGLSWNQVAAVTLADQPVFASSEVPGNLALALSVEWPTASRTAHVGTYSSGTEYLGYFDPKKCYLYQVDTTANSTNTGDLSYFYPQGQATNRTCIGDNDNKWSGNFLNWASTATIDPFRWAMTGGRRVVDTADTTILEKAWHSGQGLFPDRDLTVGEIAGATPFNGTRVGIQMGGRGFKMRLNVEGDTVRTFTAHYYNGTSPGSNSVLTVNDDNAYHNWANGSPGSGVNADNFSLRMTGTFTAPETGNYKFRTVSDDGVRVWVDPTNNRTYSDSTRVINNWTNHGSTTDTTGDIYLTEGQQFNVRIDYYESSGGATMQFLWKQPSAGDFTAFYGGSGTRDYTMRAKVCDPSAAAGGLESNCKQYGSNYKPEGLIQKYSDRIRFSAFGYLNDTSDQRDGAVLRARQKFVGPQTPVPRQAAVTNPNAEWSSVNGTFIQNPDSDDASATQTTTGVNVSYSGVMNYLNQFGQLIPGDYKNYDPVSELFYAVMRYYKNQGNVAAWSAMGSANDASKQRWVDGFPVITNWPDPIQHSCQRNFVLGIGDIYTHVDKNVAGNTTYRDREPSMPSEIAADSTVNAVTATNKVGALQGLGDLGATNSYSGRANSAYIAGLAYDANTQDIRPDDANVAKTIGKQTVQTYWVDVLEQSFVANNQFYLAAKYGGMNVPADFNPYAATTVAATIQKSWWSTTGETVTDVRGSGTTQDRPDNYYAAGQPDTLIAGLTKAFASIANAIKAYTTSFSLASTQVVGSSTAAYASQYDSRDWSGVLTARQLSFATDGTLSTTEVWSSTTKLATQLQDGGWDTDRRVVTWSGTAGVPFRATNGISADQLATLDTSYRSGDDAADYLNYLRGDRTNEAAGRYRTRNVLLGDIVNAKVTPVGPPQASYGDAYNPGYAAFKTAKRNRPTMVYVGANDGMLHAFDGSLTGTTAGREQFAYVPSELLRATDGLAELGNPRYEHRYYVDATPLAFDVDFNNTYNNFTTGSTGSGADWRTVLIGGLGKGGTSFYAIDVSDPGSITTESIAASKVLWEFKDATTSGYSFGRPTAVKTKKYGWVIVLTSGYNGPNADQQGYLYFVNPKTGALLEKVGTEVAAPGLAQATAYVLNYADYTADAIYVGDLNGKLWRFAVTQARGVSDAYPTPTHFATLTDGASTPRVQPITTAPLVEVSPQTFRRFVLVGTGQLLSTADINSSAGQSLYAILDGTSGAFSSVSSPITRADLVANTDPTLGVGALGTSKGWYVDLGSTDGTAWRMVTSLAAYNGSVMFSSLLTVGDACKPSGQSRVYFVNFTTGRTMLSSGNAYDATTSAVTDLMFVRHGMISGTGGTGSTPGQSGGKVSGVGGTSSGENNSHGGANDPNSNFRRLTWRELPTIE